jgi:protein SCO1/2
MRRALAIIGMFLVVCGSAQGQRVGSYGKAPAAPATKLNTDAIGIDQKLGDVVPLDLVFKDEHDQDITLGACVGGKPTILVLAYYRCPNVCNGVISALTDRLKELPTDVGDQFNVVIVSFDPKDQFGIAASKKMNYLKEYGRPNADKHWHFLTGQKPQIDELCQAVGFRYEYDKQKKQFNHATCIMVLTAHGKISQYLPGVDYEKLPEALKKAGAGEIGKEVEPSAIARFLCYEQNPDTGKYTLSVMKLLRVVFATLVIVLAIWLIRVWRRPSAAEVDTGT